MRIRWLPFVAVVALAAVWTISPQNVPLYDGIGEPETPYRYVAPTEGGPQTPPPETLRRDYLIDTPNSPITRENATNDFQTGWIIRPVNFKAATSGINLIATPLPPDRSPPGTTISGNIYRLSGETVPPGQPVRYVRGKEKDVFFLLATIAEAGGAMYYRPTADAAWIKISSERFGRHGYLGEMQDFGDYVLAFPGENRRLGPGAAGLPSEDGATPPSVQLPEVFAGLAVGMVLVLVGIRLARRRRLQQS